MYNFALLAYSFEKGADGATGAVKAQQPVTFLRPQLRRVGLHNTEHVYFHHVPLHTRLDYQCRLFVVCYGDIPWSPKFPYLSSCNFVLCLAERVK